jgi:C-terminal processing protease CtpA/Prc
MAVSDGPFLAGTVGEIGVLRIPEFSESRYLDACRAVAKKRLEGRDLQLAVRAELNRQLTATVGKLKAAGATKLVIDLSRNGGGSEWSSEAVTLFTKGRLTRNEPRRVGPICDRTNIWKGETPACSIYAGPQTTEWVEPDAPPPWTGPLAVIVDHHTASAAEEFATWLQDNDRAKVGGEKTFGAGCGYMDGGNAFEFRAAPMHLMIPNCSRIRRDGTNEIEAVSPDVAIDWQRLKPADVEGTFAKLF